MRQIKINSVTGSELVSVAEAKLFTRIDTSADDTLIDDMITQARVFIENYISRDVVAKNRTYYVDYTNGLFDLPFAPIASISSVTVEGEAATYDILGLDDYSIELHGGPSKHVKVTYVTAGITDSAIKQAILQLVSTLYDNRADYVTGTIVSDVPSNVKSLLAGYKTMFI